MEDDHDIPMEGGSSAAERAAEKVAEFRMHAELAAVYEGPRKFDAAVVADLSADLARQIQQSIGKLANAKLPETPILKPDAMPAAQELLLTPMVQNLSTGDYHVHRRPGETIIVRFLAGEEVATFYQRMQAHFDAALEGFKEDYSQAQGWKQDESTTAFLEALSQPIPPMQDWYLRETISRHLVMVLSTQAADEINIAYLADQLMGVTPAEIVGTASAPPEDAPTRKDLAWFFKLFSLRATIDGVERMCLFTYLQKTDDDW